MILAVIVLSYLSMTLAVIVLLINIFCCRGVHLFLYERKT